MKQTLKEYCDWLEDLTLAGDTINSKGLQDWIKSYAKEEVDKALKEKEFKTFYCYDELVNNAAEDYDSPKCINQCIKCKE